MTTKKFKEIIWRYYDEHGRHELPWRLNIDPYAILVSEVMLQQTQVARVMPKFTEWLTVWPTFAALAQASVPQLLSGWQGLGYNRRALALGRCAVEVVRQHGGVLPMETADLLALPGIGPYTASAIAAFAYNQPVVMLETNIRAVFIHHFWSDHEKIADADIIPLIEKTLYPLRPREWYWALMDYGSFLKKEHGNPNRNSRTYVRQSPFPGSNREVRGAIVRALTQQSSLPEKMLMQVLKKEGIGRTRLAPALLALEREGFIARDARGKKVALATKNQF